MKAEKRSKRGYIVNAAALAIAVGLLSILPISMVTQASSEAIGDEMPILVRQANLVSPTGSVDPHGFAEFQVYASGNLELEVEAEDVNMASGTVLDIFVDGNSVGRATLLMQRLRLKLRTEDGQSVPAIEDGSTVEVKLGSTVVVSGAFGGGGPNPDPSPTSSPTESPTASPTSSPTASPTESPTASPTASPSPDENEIYAGLSGPTINGVLPGGYAEYEVHSSRTELEIRIRRINLAPGSQFDVIVDGVQVGAMFLDSDGESRLRLRSDNGDIVPVVISGSTIEIAFEGSTILSGTFLNDSEPSETPDPNETPTPGMGRYFETHPSGDAFDPPVVTSARGEVEVSLNETETEATIEGEFHDFLSAQTGATIVVDVGTAVVIHDFGAIGGTDGHFTTVTIPVTAAQVEQLRAGLWFATIASADNPGGELGGFLTQHSDEADFDGDGSNDLAVFRPSTATWYSKNSAGFSAQQFGATGDIPVSADYDGDGKTDKAVFRNVNGNGVWEIRHSSDGGTTGTQFGFATDIPVRGDFDGDGMNDLAVFRPSNGVWYVKKSDNSGFIIVQFGTAGDKPIAGDFDGDGKADIAVFRPGTGVWYWLKSSDSSVGIVQWGQRGDIPVRGDFDGDGRNDQAVYRPSTGVWYILKSGSGTYDILQFGISEDIPVAGSYDGDNKTDIAVFRPSTGVWYIWNSSDGTFDFTQFGLLGDVPTITQ